MTWHRPSEAVCRTPRWRALRLQALRRDGFRCCDCGARGRLEVHHVEPVRTHPELGFDLGNLRSLCGSCHAQVTRVEMGGAPLSPARIEWRNAVRQLERGGTPSSRRRTCSQA
ncbi:HNH endonuclease signature motif containing protein [uncultured Amaricoccus sp.]|uniref:HNH endonuclease n=1 Tax=uncultured Amaricoccus sp. TaxID=339341 RepID=UPI002620AA12|nr:HNH endonuclease signature motif containing protein [uncultured Amaricoccus sp.]